MDGFLSSPRAHPHFGGEPAGRAGPPAPCLCGAEGMDTGAHIFRSELHRSAGSLDLTSSQMRQARRAVSLAVAEEQRGEAKEREGGVPATAPVPAFLTDQRHSFSWASWRQPAKRNECCTAAGASVVRVWPGEGREGAAVVQFRGGGESGVPGILPPYSDFSKEGMESPRRTPMSCF